MASGLMEDQPDIIWFSGTFMTFFDQVGNFMVFLYSYIMTKTVKLE